MTNNYARFEKWFELILTMLDGHNHTAKDLAGVMGTSVRNLYYVFSALKKLGFSVVHERTHYYIDPRSPFLRRISSTVDVTDDEAAYLHGLLSAASNHEAMAGTLRRKLERFYDLRAYADVQMHQRLLQNTETLEQAIAQKRVVILHNYSSSHSRSVSDRVVEPFFFQGDKTDIRAFELKTKQNKSFKISRVGKVEMLDTPWFNEDQHRQVYTDMFLFSGEERHHIKLRLSFMAHNLMLEEYPHSRSMMTKDSARHWIFETDVVSYAAISRFILGLFNEVEVLDDDGLRKYLRKRIDLMTKAIDSWKE